MKLIENRTTDKSVFTRMCISEAILILMKDIPFEKLKISSIVRKAGVSRMTFYKYYSSPYDALSDYLKIIIEEYLQLHSAEHTSTAYFTHEHILFSLLFFDRYADYFLILAQNHLHSIMLNSINEFLMERIHTRDPLSKYKILSYSGGLLNVFLNWEKTGKRDSADDIATTICNFYNFDRNS